VSVLTVGLSHRSASVELLERAALPEDAVVKLLGDLAAADHVDEALVLSTCNRVEVYAVVTKFHGGVQDVTERLARHTGIAIDDLSEHLYVHYEDRAVQHLFSVAAGLDSMVVGEQQVLGQLRGSLQAARGEGTVSRTLNQLVEQALHAGKRAHAETGIDAAGRSVVSVGLDLAAESLGGLTGRRAVLVGAGAMSGLAAAMLKRSDVGSVTVINRSPDRARRLADAVDGTTATMAELTSTLTDADLLVSCTGAVGTVVAAASVAAAMQHRAHRPLFVLDLALPRDVEPAVRELDGVTVVDLDALRSVLQGAEVAADVDAARRIVTEEVGEFLTRQRSERVAPTVVALRARAQQVVDDELARLRGRLPALDARADREISATVQRVVDKLLHAPTVRIKELDDPAPGASYAEVVRDLFALDAAVTEVVTRADIAVEDEAGS
jgi:glutamyl-tRNA reductase